MTTVNAFSALGRVVNQKAAKIHRQNVSNLLGRQSLSFPGTQPVSFSREHIHHLEDNNYFLSEKTDGDRCLLYFAWKNDTDGHPIAQQYLIDRTNNYFELAGDDALNHGDNITQVEDVEWYKGTLLDGELVLEMDRNNNAHHILIVADCLAINGKPITHQSFATRRRKVKSLFFDIARKHCKSACGTGWMRSLDFHLKAVMPTYDLKIMLEEIIPNLMHSNDGIIMTCEKSPYVFGADHNMFKWKTPGDITVDFCLDPYNSGAYTCNESGSDHASHVVWVQLFAYQGSQGHCYYADMRLSNEELRFIVSKKDVVGIIVLECLLDSRGCWRPKLGENGLPIIRYDKRRANHISILPGILKSIRDAVTADELLQRLDEISKSWFIRNSAASWN